MENFLSNLFRKRNFSDEPIITEEKKELKEDVNNYDSDKQDLNLKNKKEEKIDKKNQRIFKLNDTEYLFDDIPPEGKHLIMLLRKADNQIKIYEDNLKLISISKNKMVEDLKKILDKIEPFQNK